MLLDGLTITIVGMSVVFVFLTLLVVFMKLLSITISRFLPADQSESRNKNRQTMKQSGQLITQVSNDGEIAAAIAAVRVFIDKRRGIIK